MTEPSNSAPGELPRRLAGELDIPAPDPNKPLYFETRDEVLTRVRDGLEGYDPPEGKERPSADFCWMQPTERADHSQPIPRK
ncbi:hypothetical protein [Parasphingorhabdus pacifica]